MVGEDDRWVARLTAPPGGSTEALLGQSLGLDVWERQPDALLVAADEGQLAEIERRRLAIVERLEPVRHYIARREREV